MNKTISINIGGQFFHIDEDAFSKLDNYINAIKKSINTEGKDEIIADIESRIAELFQQRILQPNGVIKEENVNDIITIMGQPEDYIISDEPINNTNTFHNFDNDINYTEGKTNRKLYRDPSQKVLGGVCSGIGNYFNIDPVWIRILFIVLIFFYGVPLLAYPILWIIIPKAVSPSQILEMKGIPVNINNIEKEVRESLGKYINGSKKVVSKGTNIIKKFVGITLIIFSITAIFGSGFAPLSLINTSSKINNNFPLSTINLEQYIDFPVSHFTVGILFFLCCALPFFMLLLVGIKLVYSKMKNTRWILLILAIIWIACSTIIAYLIFQVKVNKDEITNAIENFAKTEITNKTELLLSSKDTLVLNFKNDNRLYANDTISNNNYNVNRNILVNFSQSTVDQTYVEIEETRFLNTNTHISINGGKYKVETSKIPTSLPYEMSYNKPVLNLSKSILTHKNNLQDYDDDDIDSDVSRVRVNIYLKEGQLVKLNEEDDRYFYDRLEDGIQVYRMTNGSLVPTQGTQE